MTDGQLTVPANGKPGLFLLLHEDRARYPRSYSISTLQKQIPPGSLLLVRELLPVLAGSHAGILMKSPDQVAGIIKSAGKGDFGDVFFRMFQSVADLLDPVPQEIFHCSLTDIAVHEFIEVIGGNFCGGGEFGEGEFFGVVFGDEVKQ